MEGNGAKRKLRVAAVGDLHCRESQRGRFQEMVSEVNEKADVLILCGDLTDHGKLGEGKTLAGELSRLRIPCAAVLGNHDFEDGHVEELVAELRSVGVRVLDGDHIIFDDWIGVAGVKGFCGGFGNATLQAFGEEPIKAFVQEGVKESLKLEAALSQLDTEKKVVALHYAPIAATVVGEKPEIQPFLGSGRLAMSIDQFGAAVALHGHAHHGTYEGTTPGGVPVFNVAMPVMAKRGGSRFALMEV